MKQIENRTDIARLVGLFYGKIRKDTLLGTIFNRHIATEQWPEHLEKLTDFWETNLFGVQKFKGNPTQKHIKVDNNLNNTIETKHFEKWLALWTETIEEHYEGELADKAKFAAQKMAQGQFLMVLRHRGEF